MLKQTIKAALIYILATILIWSIISFISPTKGMLVGEVAYGAFLKALAIIIAVFIIIGLIQVWVGPQTLAKILGKESG